MKKYIFKSYDPIYPKLFNKEKGRLKKFLGEAVLIEHVGSTSIVGMGGKGIIDIVVAANSKDGLSNISSKLIEAGYYYDPKDGTEDRWFHERKVSNEERYHIHLTFKDSRDWNEMTSFRNYLNTHTEDFKKYEEVKKLAAAKANENREIYLQIKDPILEEIITKALKV